CHFFKTDKPLTFFLDPFFYIWQTHIFLFIVIIGSKARFIVLFIYISVVLLENSNIVINSTFYYQP
ncbi:uncharacterized protein EV154DRAFT_529817, partial [Mucor mucedo]|uniref:uncharacterized protein n=1 Tax=Mucor mucedo TaxID=29922 RepID=UPI00221E6362